MDKISSVLDFVIGLNFTFDMYSISQLQVLGKFKKVLKTIFSLLS